MSNETAGGVCYVIKEEVIIRKAPDEWWAFIRELELQNVALWQWCLWVENDDCEPEPLGNHPRMLSKWKALQKSFYKATLRKGAGICLEAGYFDEESHSGLTGHFFYTPHSCIYHLSPAGVAFVEDFEETHFVEYQI